MRVKNTILTSLLFFLVLSSWYVLRAVRNEMAVENYGQDFLLILLSITALTMLLINPLYSWIASRENQGAAPAGRGDCESLRGAVGCVHG